MWDLVSCLDTHVGSSWHFKGRVAKSPFFNTPDTQCQCVLPGMIFRDVRTTSLKLLSLILSGKKVIVSMQSI